MTWKSEKLQSDKTYYKMITEIVKKFVLWGSHVSLSLSRFNSASSFLKCSVMRLNKAFPATLVTSALLAWNIPPFVLALLPTWHVLVHLALLSPFFCPILLPANGNFSRGFSENRGWPPFSGFLSSRNNNFAQCPISLGELFMVTTWVQQSFCVFFYCC